MTDRTARLLVVSAGLATTGGAVSVTGAAAPTLDTGADPGGEARVESAAALGNPVLRVRAALAAGGGYAEGWGAGYGLIS